MNGVALEFMFQALPIAVGIAIFLAARSIRISKEMVRIDECVEDTALHNAQHGAMDYDKCDCSGNGYERFNRYAYELLITSGVFEDKKKRAAIARAAFERCAVIAYAGAGMLPLLLRRRPQRSLTMVMTSIAEREKFISAVSSFGRQSGLLLAYAINYRLKIEGA